MKLFTNYIDAVNYADMRSHGDIFYSVEFVSLDRFKVVKTRLNDDLKKIKTR